MSIGVLAFLAWVIILLAPGALVLCGLVWLIRKLRKELDDDEVRALDSDLG